MKINLEQKEIEDAIILYIESQGISLEGREVLIEMTAGRNPPKHYADVTILPKGESAADQDTDTPETDNDTQEAIDTPFGFMGDEGLGV